MNLMEAYRMILRENVNSLHAQLMNRYYDDGLELVKLVQHNSNIIEIASIRVRDNSRGKGVGSNVMSDICEYADKNKQILLLHPSPLNSEIDKWRSTMSTDKLVNTIELTSRKLSSFYIKFGFVGNSGKTVDLEMSRWQSAMGGKTLMYRDPK